MKIESASELNLGTEVVLDEVSKTVELLEAGNLVMDDGVTGEALQEFLGNSRMIKHCDECFEFMNGWSLKDDTTRVFLVEAGFILRNAYGRIIARQSGRTV